MKLRPFVILVLALALGLPISGAIPTRAQAPAPSGVVVFRGITSPAGGDPAAALVVLDVASGRIGPLDAPTSPHTVFDWHPATDMLAFTTDDGSYGLLRGLSACALDPVRCTNMVFVVPPFTITGLAWLPGGSSLVLQTDEGLKIAPPRIARPQNMRAHDLSCDAGFALDGPPIVLACASTDAQGRITVGVYDAPVSVGAPFDKRYELGTFPAITGLAIGPEGQSAIGTQETAGDSGFFAQPDGQVKRLAPYQVHVYDLAFNPDAGLIALAGATADSTGDGSLTDGDSAELLLYTTSTGELVQIPGFTGAVQVAWSPSDDAILVASQDSTIAIYTLATRQTRRIVLSSALDMTVTEAAWYAIEPAVVERLPFVTATRVPTLTPAATLTPPPSPTPRPLPTSTPVPSATPGSPIGSGCQFAPNPAQVAVGDAAQVTTRGAAVRLRASPAVDGLLLRELLPGTPLQILNGPYCGQGYRWWQARAETDGSTGYLADGDLSGFWIERVAPPPPTVVSTPFESISFFADRYTINPGQCVTVTWSVAGIKAVYYQGAGVTGSESRVECPPATTAYRLDVTRQDNSVITQMITIFVVSP